MTMPATTREPLRRQAQADRNLQLLCAGLTASSTLVLATQPAGGDTLRSADEPPPLVPAAAPPQRTLGESFDHALKALTTQDWQGFVTQCASTVWNAPVAFGEAILVGIYDYIKNEVKSAADTLSSIAKWAGNAWSCVWDIGLSGVLDPDQILRSTACAPFHSIAKGLQALKRVAAEMVALGVAGVIEMVGEFMQSAIELLNVLLSNLLQWLGDRAAAIRQWLTETARDVKALGGMAGSLIAAILIEIATSGLGRALKTSKLVSRLPDALPGAAPAAVTDGGWIVARSSMDDMLKMLGELADVMQKILNQQGANFTRNLNARRLRIIRKNMNKEDLKKLNTFMQERKKLARAVAKKLKEMRGGVRPYNLSTAEARELNRRVLAFHYAEALKEGDFNDYYELLGRRDAILPQIFESNHIIEARMFRSGKWRNEFDLLGWDDETKMDAIVLTAAEHTSSTRRMLQRWEIPDVDTAPDSIDIARLAPPKSVTQALLDKIKFGGTHGSDVLVIKDDTPFSAVFSKYMEVYRQELPDLWNADRSALRGQFLRWKDMLNLDVVVPGPI